MPRFVAADELTGVVRTFGFFATGGAEGPDFVGDDSLGVLVLPAPNESPHVIEFSLFEADLAGTLWVRHPAMHLSKGQNQGGAFYWLITEETPTPPEAGSLALTAGPLASVVFSADFRISLCNGDCCSGDDNLRYRVVNVGGTPFVVVTALFSK